MTRRTRSSSAAPDIVSAPTTTTDVPSRRTRSTSNVAAAQPSASKSSTPRHHAPRRKKRKKSSAGSKLQLLASYTLDGEEYRLGDNVYVAMANFMEEQDDDSTDICQICKKSPRSAFVLECCSCLHGYHGRCLHPPLTSVPTGDWLCPRCNSGNPPPPPPDPRTALQMVLYGDSMLSLARIEGFADNRDGTEEMSMLVKYYSRSDKTHRGRLNPFRAREMYLETSAFWEPVDSIYRKATVCRAAEFPDSQGDDVFLCDFMYDAKWKRFIPIDKAAAEGADEMELGSESDGEDDHTYRPDKDKSSRKGEPWKREGQVAALEEISKQAFVMNAAAEPVAPVCPYAAMKESLTTGAVPAALPCRDEEKACIKRFVTEGITGRGSTNVLYICGVPGTGKTASVIEVIFHMRVELHTAGVQFVAINGLQVPSPQHVYSKFWERISGQKASPARALSLLEERFSSATLNPSKNEVFSLVVVDEVDVLMTRDQAVLYNLFEWPMRAAAKLCVIAISNTHDLDERVLPRIASRLAASKLVFKPYTVDQLGCIVKQRLADHALVQPGAVDFAARKVSSDSGDARRVLELMRRAVEVAEAENKADTSQHANKPVGIRHVNEAIKEMYNSIHMQYLRSCALMEKLLLVGIAQETRSLSRPECSLQGAVKRMSLFCQMIGQEEPKPSFMVPVAYRLTAKRLILAGPTSQHLKMKVALNVQAEDIAAVIKTDTSLQQLAGFL